jgi:hypothetical protein
MKLGFVQQRIRIPRKGTVVLIHLDGPVDLRFQDRLEFRRGQDVIAEVFVLGIDLPRQPDLIGKQVAVFFKGAAEELVQDGDEVWRLAASMGRA